MADLITTTAGLDLIDSLPILPAFLAWLFAPKRRDGLTTYGVISTLRSTACSPSLDANCH